MQITQASFLRVMLHTVACEDLSSFTVHNFRTKNSFSLWKVVNKGTLALEQVQLSQDISAIRKMNLK